VGCNNSGNQCESAAAEACAITGHTSPLLGFISVFEMKNCETKNGEMKYGETEYGGTYVGRPNGLLYLQSLPSEAEGVQSVRPKAPEEADS